MDNNGLDAATKAELKKLWESVVEVTYDFYFRLADSSLNLTEAIPGLKVVVQDGDAYVAEVPEASLPALKALEAEGKLPDPSAEQVARLTKLHEEWKAARASEELVLKPKK